MRDDAPSMRHGIGTVAQTPGRAAGVAVESAPDSASDTERTHDRLTDHPPGTCHDRGHVFFIRRTGGRKEEAALVTEMAPRSPRAGPRRVGTSCGKLSPPEAM